MTHAPCRLHACSDYCVMDVCANCGLLISTLTVPAAASSGTHGASVGGGRGGSARVCRLCDSGAAASPAALRRLALLHSFWGLAAGPS